MECKGTSLDWTDEELLGAGKEGMLTGPVSLFEK
jgi:hypothetical protein